MKKVKNFISFTLILAVMMSFSVIAFADDSSVTYEGGAEDFVFLPSDDLFVNFKGAMPGDVLTQIITIKNEYDGSDKVNIYLRAEPHDEEENPLSDAVAELETVATMQDFLAQLSMTVKKGDEVIFEAAASELGGLEENVLLGTFRKGDTAELTVELAVPADLGNEYAYRAGEVDWVFLAEELDDPEQPETGDNAMIVLWAALLAAAIGGMVVLFVTGRKKNHSK